MLQRGSSWPKNARLADELFAKADDKDALRDVYITQYNLGNAWFQRGSLEKSLAAFQAAVDCLETSPLTAENDRLQIDLATGLSRLGQLQGRLGNWDKPGNAIRRPFPNSPLPVNSHPTTRNCCERWRSPMINWPAITCKPIILLKPFQILKTMFRSFNSYAISIQSMPSSRGI